MFRVAVARNLRRWLALLLLLLGLQQLAGAALIKAKAWLAPVLIETAWAQTLARGGEPVKPWSWADTWPVARLQAPAQEVELLVLAGDSGNALAFGPGHATASATLGAAGLAVIGGHRDTHFAFLRDLPVGALLQLELPDGRWRSYTVESSRVVDASRELLPAGLAEEVLLLVTCYPFDALQSNGPLRYVVRAIPIAASDQDPRVAGPAAL
ncbi:MAG: class GN sortase [Halieaceae bacterium]|nr:class GN sortase [Halieaceae bacterium]MCP5147627.1 class GN sortase [Pseudomonadales bacterium]